MEAKTTCDADPWGVWRPDLQSCSPINKCLLPDLEVHYGNLFSEEIVVFSFGGSAYASVQNVGEADAHNVTLTVGIPAPFVLDTTFPVTPYGGGTCTSTPNTVTCTFPLLTPGNLGSVGFWVKPSSTVSCGSTHNATATASTPDAELKYSNNTDSVTYRVSCGACCKYNGTCTDTPKSQCDTTNPFQTDVWLAPPDSCSKCPAKSSSSSSSSSAKQVCCIYDRESTIQGTWEVLDCQMRPKTSTTTTICHNVGETMEVRDSEGEMVTTTIWGEPRTDIQPSQCTSANAAAVCDKGVVDLSLQKLGGPFSGLVPGSVISFKLLVRNNSTTTPAVDVFVVDYKNPNLIYQGTTGGSCTEGSNGVTCSLGNIPPGGFKSVIVNYMLHYRQSSGCTVTNSALAFADNKDPNSSNNYASLPFNAYCQGSSSSNSSKSGTSGSSVSSVSSSSSKPATYACCIDMVAALGAPTKRWSCVAAMDAAACSKQLGREYGNLPPMKVIDAVFRDGVQCADAQCGSVLTTIACCLPGAPNGCKVLYGKDCLAAGGTLTDKVSCGANTCGGSSTSGTSTSKSTSSSSKSSSLSKSSSSSSATADITVTKMLAAKAPAGAWAVGDTLTYTITIQNKGAVDATGITLTDFIPNGVDIVSMPGTCTDNGVTITCTGISVPKQGSTPITISFKIRPLSTICTSVYTIGSNRAFVQAPAQFDKNATNNIGEAAGFSIPCPPQKFCCAPNANACGATKVQLVNGKCPSPAKAGTEAGYDDKAACDTACKPAPKFCCAANAVACGATKVDLVNGKCPTPSKAGTEAGYDDKMACDSACKAPPKSYCCSNDACVEFKTGVSCKAGTLSNASDCGGVDKCKPAPKKWCCDASGTKKCYEVTGATCPGGGAAAALKEDCEKIAACKLPVKYCCDSATKTCGETTAATCPGGGTPTDQATCKASAACKADPTIVWCCNDTGVGNKYACSPHKKEEGCGLIGTTKSDGYALQSECEQQPLCKPAPGTGQCCVPSLEFPDDPEKNSCSPTITSEDECAMRNGAKWLGPACSAECGKPPKEGNACCLLKGGKPTCETAAVLPCGTQGGVAIPDKSCSEVSCDAQFERCCCKAGKPMEGVLAHTNSACTQGGGTWLPGTTRCGPATCEGIVGTFAGVNAIGGTDGIIAGGSRSASSTSSANKTCGPCAGLGQSACTNGPFLCTWQGSTFGFLSVFFGGTGGTCSKAPQCSGTTISSANSSSKSSAKSSSSASSRSSSSSSKSLLLLILGLQAQPACGDLLVQGNEQCEPRLLNLFGKTCTNMCRWSACTDGVDNDGDGYVDRFDGGCYASGIVPTTVSQNTVRSLLAQFLFQLPATDFVPAHDSETCPDGMTDGANGNCTALPNCPASTVRSNPTSLLVYCTNSCATSKTKGQCSAACVCGCRPNGGTQPANDAAACVNGCLEGGESDATCAARCIGQVCRS